LAKLITVLLLFVGIINLLPIVGLLGSAKLESAYKINIVSSDLLILMQHRALLFGLLGAFIIYSAFVPSYQTAAMIMAGISMIGFAALFHGVGSSNQALVKVLYADYVGLFLLIIAIFLKLGLKNNL